MAGPNSLDPIVDNTLLPYGENLIAQGDDNSEMFDITSVFESGFLFGGRTFEELFVSTNGGVTFIDQTLNFAGTFENTDFVIAPFYDDLDNRTLPPGPTPGIYFDENLTRDSVVVTWDGVGIFSNNVDFPNTFQLEIIDLEDGDARVIFRYEDMGNSRGNSFQMGLVADGGPRLFLRGGTSTDELGFAADMDTLIGNTGIAGVWAFDIIDGQLQIDDLIGETQFGNDNPNTLIGTDRNDVLSGGGGNDTIFGRLGIDRLNGDDGDDFIDGEGDDDILHGNAGFDTLDGGSGDDTLFGDGDDDTLYGHEGVNYLDGGSGADYLDGASGTSFAAYGSSSSGLTVNLGDTSQNTGDAVGDTYVEVYNVSGSDFNDDLTGDSFDNILMGGDGNDALSGGDGLDTLFGQDGDDTLVGGNDGDVLTGGAGADVLIGGGGNNYASYSDTDEGIVVDLLTPSNNTGDAAGDSYSGINYLVGSTGDDTLSGNTVANEINGLDGDDLIQGREGNDTLYGDNGDDTLEGGEGADELSGGRGINTASYANATAGVFASLTNSGGNTGEAAGDTYNQIQNLLGSDFNDTLEGDSQANMLAGGSGNDSLIGQNEDDILQGGAGSDTLVGGSGFDTADYANAASGVSASLSDPNTNSGDARGDVYSSIENLVGSVFNDTLEGDGGNNIVMAGDGDDLIRIFGGSDSVDGGLGEDTVSFENTSFVVIDLADNSANGGAAAGSEFTNVENVIGSAGSDDLLGNELANALSGGGNNDNIEGRDGDDTLDGGSGNDTLVGGAGFDTFVVSTGMGNDTITDYNVNEDSLDLSGLSASERAAITSSDDGNGNRVLTLGDGSTVTIIGVPPNFAPTGTVAVTGLPLEDEFLTADTSTLDDQDDLGTLSYEWLRNGSPIAGANDASTYQLTQADVGTAISVRVSYTDGFGTEEELLSNATSTVANVNDAPTGSVTITGTPAEGSILLANFGTIADGDDLGPFTITWLRDGNAIAGADAASYTLTPLDANADISVQISYVDGQGTPEMLSSSVIFVAGPVGAFFGGTPSADTYFGGAGNDTIRGQDGNDVLTGGAYFDDIMGEGGLDTLYGGPGNDTLDGGADVDLIGAGPGDDSMIGGDGDDLLFGALGNDTGFGGLGNDTLGGSNGNDSLSGDDGDDEVWGARDNDTISGGNGNDTVGGFLGDDSIDGNAGDDELWGADGADTMNGGDGADQVGAGAGNDLVDGGAGNDGVYGGRGNDVVNGGSGNDTVFGAAGDDTIDGGDGSDQMFAGPGADVIIFSAGQDEAFFFSAADDRIDLRAVATITDAADLFADHLTTVGGEAVILDGLGNTLTLDGISVASLGADNFIF